MSIYIPNLILPPDDRQDLFLCIQHDGTVLDPWGNLIKTKAIEVLPHGRCIDADAFAAKFIAALPGGIDDLIDKSRAPEFVSQIQALLMDIAEAPTIIPADREDTR